MQPAAKELEDMGPPPPYPGYQPSPISAPPAHPQQPPSNPFYVSHPPMNQYQDHANNQQNWAAAEPPLQSGVAPHTTYGQPGIPIQTFPPPAQQQIHVVVAGSPTSRYPQPLNCPNCKQVVTSYTQNKAGCRAIWSCLLIFMAGLIFWPAWFVCWIPLVVSSCKGRIFI